MSEIIKLTAKWDNFAGAPGYTNFYFLKNLMTSAVEAGEAIYLFFDALKASIPNGIVIQVQPEVTTYVAETGVLVSVDALDPIPAAVTGTASGSYSGVSGAVVNWLTTQSMGTRLLRGRTFLVPLSAGAYQTDGTLAPAFMTTLKGAAENLRLAYGAELCVWHRPTDEGPGMAVKVSGSRIPDMAAILRSRRR